MKWEHETWRKLYVRVTARWLALPLSARGLGDELIKYADDDGLIVISDEEAGGAVARLCGAHPHERKRVKADTMALIKDGFLTVEVGGLRIRNLREAQARSTSADRMARKRERDRVNGAPLPSHVTPGDTSRDASPVRAQSDGSRARGSDPVPISSEEKPPTPVTHGVVIREIPPPRGSPEAVRIFDVLRAMPSLAPVATVPVACMLASRFATAELRGVKLAWVFDAIADCAADCATGGLTAEAMARKLRTYCDHAKPPREHANGHAKTYDSPKLTEAQRTAEKAAASKRMEKLEAAAARIDAGDKEPAK